MYRHQSNANTTSSAEATSPAADATTEATKNTTLHSTSEVRDLNLEDGRGPDDVAARNHMDGEDGELQHNAIELQWNEAYGVEVEGARHNAYENILEYI